MSTQTVTSVIAKVVPWALLLAVVASLRTFWALIFLSFVIGSLMQPLAARLTERTGLSHKRSLSAVYLLLVCVIALTLVLLVPRAWKQGIEFGRHRMPLFWGQVSGFLEDQIPEETRAKVVATFSHHIEGLSPSSVLTDAATIVKTVGRLCLFAFLSLIFSFLVLLDPTFVTEAACQLRRCRLGWIYCEIEGPVVAFFKIVARVFDAQIVIALINTTLTLFGMLFFGIPGAMFLTVVVFLCGLIPVVGAFLSSIPILISALVQGGLALTIEGLVMVLVVHALEAYVLNPRIMGEHLHMHPFTVMVTLLVSEHFFGIWGVLLGVPAVTYTVHQITGDASPPPSVAEGAGTPSLSAPPAAV